MQTYYLSEESNENVLLSKKAMDLDHLRKAVSKDYYKAGKFAFFKVYGSNGKTVGAYLGQFNISKFGARIWISADGNYQYSIDPATGKLKDKSRILKDWSRL